MKDTEKKESYRYSLVHKVVVELKHPQLGVLENGEANVRRGIHLELQQIEYAWQDESAMRFG